MSVREQVRALWKTCFHDPEAFVELYFNGRYEDGLNESIEMDGRVVAALQCIPYRLKFENLILPVAYVSGACTHPEYRERGLMRKLLAQAHQRMFREGVLLSALIPAEEWLKGYYARSGYSPCFQRGRHLLTVSSLPADNLSRRWSLVEIMPGSVLCEEAFRLYDRFQSGCEARILHDWDDFNIILADLLLSGGQLWGAVEKEELQGICFCLPEKGRLAVKEIVCREKVFEQAMLRRLSSHYGLMCLECGSFLDGGLHEVGMARVVNVEALLRLLAGRWTGSHSFRVEDDEGLPQNNGWYNLEKGGCFKGKLEGQTYQTVSVGELVCGLFGEKRPYMNLMLD